MLKVGVTGGIGSGKSTVSKLFTCLEIPVFNADEAGRNLLNNDPQTIEEVTKLFGKEIIKDGKPDRKKIAELVFKNPENLAKLNSVIHPAVRRKFNEWATGQHAAYCIDEAAILIETEFYKQLDYTILVIAPEQLRIKRVMQREGMTENTIRDRMNNQWTDDEKKKYADFEILNDEITPLLPQVLEFHNRLIAESK